MTVVELTATLAWLFFGLVNGAALCLAIAYFTLPFGTLRLRAHVMLLAASYAIFTSVPILHAVGMWPHDVTQTGILHFGSPGWYVLLLGTALGVVGIVLALAQVCERIRNGRGT